MVDAHDCIGNWRRFHSYLLSLPAGSEVGYTWSSQGSPITRWLEQETGQRYEIWAETYNLITGDDNECDEEAPDWKLPKWAQRFTARTDGRKDRYFSSIDREQALSVLETITTMSKTEEQNQPCVYRDRGIVCHHPGTHKVAIWHPEQGEIFAYLCEYHYGTMSGEVAQRL